MDLWIIIGSVSSAALFVIGVIQLWLMFKDNGRGKGTGV